jgi:hypothetical protein
LKDRLQEVKETLLLGNAHLHPKGISALRQYTKKKAIKTNPYPDPWDHRFPPGPLAFPTRQSFSSFLYK